MVITSRNKNFCVGADLNLILSFINNKKWSEIDAVLKTSQDIYIRNKYSYKPVVIAPFGMALGGEFACATGNSGRRLVRNLRIYKNLEFLN